MEDSIEIVDGAYGSYAHRVQPGRPLWSCYESSDYHYYAVMDDFGNLTQVSWATNMRGY